MLNTVTRGAPRRKGIFQLIVKRLFQLTGHKFFMDGSQDRNLEAETEAKDI